MTISVENAVAILRPVKELAGEVVWREAVACLSGSGCNDLQSTTILRTPADLDDFHLPQGAPVSGPDWTDIANAIHETGWSESWLRKYRYKLGVLRSGVWYMNRPRLALFPKPVLTDIKRPSVLNRVKS